MNTKIKIFLVLAVACHSQLLNAAPIYLECNSLGENYQGGKVTHLISLFEESQSASITVKETGYARSQLPATFDADRVTIVKSGKFESDEFVIDRVSLNIKITTTGESSKYIAGTGKCRIIQPVKRAF